MFSQTSLLIRVKFRMFLLQAGLLKVRTISSHSGMSKEDTAEVI